MTVAVHRVLLDSDPFTAEERPWRIRGDWPARWVGVPEAARTPLVAGYRLPVRIAEPQTIRLHVSADERYELYVDGEPVGRGPDRGDLDHWRFESYDWAAEPGDHVIAARVWSVGAGAPFAQFTLGHGFLLASDTHPELATGTAEWVGAELDGYTFLDRGVAWGTGEKTAIDGRRYPWGWERGAGTWAAVEPGDTARASEYATDLPPGRLLVPTVLPAQRSGALTGARVRYVADWSGRDTADEPVRTADSDAAGERDWQGLLDGGALTIPPGTRVRVIVDLDDYACAYPELATSGGAGAEVRLNWQESLVDPDGIAKGDRDAVEGKLFRAPGRGGEIPVGDRFTAGGGEELFRPLWWEAGRYVEVLVATAESPLTLRALRFVETGYPYEDVSTFRSDDAGLDDVRRLAFRTLQMCSHETTIDCPYYEQLQYAGDARIQCLVAYVTSGDDRLARQTLLAFDHSRDSRGLTTSRYPSVIRQHIPPFSLWWVAMVHDFAAWRGDLAFVRRLLPGVRAVLDAFQAALDADGLVHPLPGWTFVDWVPDWDHGTPPNVQWGPSSIHNLQLAYVAELAAEVEGWLGDEVRAVLDRRLAERARDAAAAFWDDARGLYADDVQRTSWSEHAQALAVLAGAPHAEPALRTALAAGQPAVERTSVYFDHYLFEALGRIGATDVLRARLDLWRGLPASGLRTVIEKPEPSRSDCHAWGAHPVFHLVATVLGIRPLAPGMGRIAVRPQLGGLGWAEASLPTPHGTLTVRAGADGVAVEAPEGIVVV